MKMPGFYNVKLQLVKSAPIFDEIAQCANCNVDIQSAWISYFGPDTYNGFVTLVCLEPSQCVFYCNKTVNKIGLVKNITLCKRCPWAQKNHDPNQSCRATCTALWNSLPHSIFAKETSFYSSAMNEQLVYFCTRMTQAKTQGHTV